VSRLSSEDPQLSPAERLVSSYSRGPGINDAEHCPLPSRENVTKVCDLALTLFFPGFFTSGAVTQRDLPEFTKSRLAALGTALRKYLHGTMAYTATREGRSCAGVEIAVRDHVHQVIAELTEVRELVLTDVEAAFVSDPAAADRATVILSYPCIEALAVQRFAHRLYRRGIPIFPRMLTEVAHSRTGIDIHPGATLDESFFIDHGTGVVIGETSRIGKHCVLYQGVGLVAWNPLAKDEHGELKRGASNKRHPDLEDHVTIYAGATVLGGDTVIGHHSVIGGNVWLTHSVEPYSVVTNKDPELNIRKRKNAKTD
jgi:serine O-acetyltransferase